jgi:beta-lactamase regulating signal transducer with metallopeptidase domain
MQRIYLIASLMLSLLMPGILAGIDSVNPVTPAWQSWLALPLLEGVSPEVTTRVADASSPLSLWWVLAGIYMIVVGIRLLFLIREAIAIRRFIVSARREKRKGFTLFYDKSILRPFSFFNFIFLNDKLNEDEQRYAISHEKAHVTGLHSWDNLFFELAKAFLWFHPCMYLYKRYLSEVHEYLADQKVISQFASRKSYANFLLEHTSFNDGQRLMLGLSNKLITKRILMLSKPSIRPITYVYIFLLIPVGLLSFMACSMLENEPQQEKIEETSIVESEYIQYDGKIVRQVIWEGNTVYSDDQLTEALGIYPGEIFSHNDVTQSLGYRPDGKDISSLYMDNGHLFFVLQPEVTEVDEDMVDLKLLITEGMTMEIGSICMTSEDGLKLSVEELDIKPGELFNRSALIASMDKLKTVSGDMEVSMTPTPDPEAGTVNINFIIASKESN